MEVNCATLRGDNAMSALFGHVKGAFTGAIQARGGLLKEAGGGILFLDEIAELGADEQAMLLKAIEEKRFFPYGSDHETESDFSLIAGTHRNLAQRVSEGLFREDLYARINMWTFALPGWRSAARILSRTWIMSWRNTAATSRPVSGLIPTPGSTTSPLPAHHRLCGAVTSVN